MEFVLVAASLVLACGIAFAIVVLVTGNDPGLVQLSADGAPADLPTDRPLSETDVNRARFDTGLRGYRTSQVDDALARLAYDVGFKDELIKVLASEVAALRDGRETEADALREVRQRALGEAAVTSTVATGDIDIVSSETTKDGASE
jgi:DivIVA domain-containing protein